MTTKQGVRIALKVLGVGGLFGTIVIAPNAVGAYSKLVLPLIEDEPTRIRVYKELKRQGLIQITEEKDGIRLGLTIKAAHKLLAIGADEVTIPLMKKWDYQWRLVCFDIPSGKSAQRMYFNRRLHELGFTMLQRSMWVHPFECIDEIKLITDYVQLTKYISVLEVVKLDEKSTKILLRKYENLIKT
jgi:CRISPR-associated endonuclease Cas2